MRERSLPPGPKGRALPVFPTPPGIRSRFIVRRDTSSAAKLGADDQADIYFRVTSEHSVCPPGQVRRRLREGKIAFETGWS